MATRILAEKSASPTPRSGDPAQAGHQEATARAKKIGVTGLPAGARELAVDALAQVEGLATAALLAHQHGGDSGLCVELSAAVRHMLQRISELTDGVLSPLLHTGDDLAYNANDFENMKKVVYGPEVQHG